MYNVRKQIRKKVINTGFRIKINYKKTCNGYILYLNYRKMNDGVTKQQTKHLVTLTGTDKMEDLKRISSALKLRAELARTFEPDIKIFKKASDKVLLTDYIEQYMNKYKVKKTAETFQWVRKHIINCFGQNTTLSQIDKAFCERFKEYLIKKLPKASNLYFTKFKQVLHRAIDEGLISEMTFLKRMSIKTEESIREFLD